MTEHYGAAPNPIDPEDITSVLAGELRDALENRLQAEAADPEGRIEEIVDEAIGRVAEAHILERLSQLTPQEFAELYERTQGPSALTPHLDSLLEIREAQLAREARLSRISYEVSASGRLPLAEVPAATVLTVGLFDPARPDMAAHRHSGDPSVRPLHRVLQVRLDDPETGVASVLTDRWVGPRWAQQDQPEVFSSHSRIEIGTIARNEAGEPGLTANISLHAPVSYKSEATGEVVTPPQIVGFIETSDGEMLMDGPSSR